MLNLKSPPKTLEELFRHGADAAKMLFEAQGKLMPMWLCLTDEGKILPITGIMPEPEHRNALAEGLKALFQDQNVVMYVAMLESWVRKVNKDDPSAADYMDGTKRVSDDPSREEIILIQAEAHDGRSMGGTYDIMRADGKAALGEFKPTDGLAAGRFSDLLTPPRRLTPH